MCDLLPGRVGERDVKQGLGVVLSHSLHLPLSGSRESGHEHQPVITNLLLKEAHKTSKQKMIKVNFKSK